MNGIVQRPLLRRRTTGGARRRALVWIASLGVLVGTSVQAAQIDVGTGVGCEAATIQEALGIAGFNLPAGSADEIRLTRTVTYDNINVEISDWDANNEGALTISGGWDSCSDASASGRTVLDGLGGWSILEVNSPAETSLVTLRNLELTGALWALRVYDDSEVQLESTHFRLNDFALVARDGAQVYLDSATLLSDNGSSATDGAGVNCAGAGTKVTLAGVVSGNEVADDGGGVYARDGCVVRLEAGARIENNRAGRGGGIALSGAASLEGGGAGEVETVISGNTAADVGGGIWMSGAGPLSLLGNVRILDNIAGLRGGGVALEAGARLQIERFNFEPCAATPRCTVLSDNQLVSGSEGSAVHVEGGAEFRMMQGFLEGNAGAGEVGQAVHAAGAGSAIYLEGVQLWNNRTSALLRAENEAEIVASFVSAAGNSYRVSPGVYAASLGAQALLGGEVRFHASVLADHSVFLGETGGSVRAHCLLAETAQGLASSTGSPLVGVDPRFVQPATGNLRLRLDSPAVDSCDASHPTPPDADYDVDGRGFDLVWKANLLGAFDRGADEVEPLFANGFGSGDTNGWSATVP